VAWIAPPTNALNRTPVSEEIADEMHYAAERVGALSDSAIRPSVRSSVHPSVCPMLLGRRCLTHWHIVTVKHQ